MKKERDTIHIIDMTKTTIIIMIAAMRALHECTVYLIMSACHSQSRSIATCKHRCTSKKIRLAVHK